MYANTPCAGGIVGGVARREHDLYEEYGPRSVPRTGEPGYTPLMALERTYRPLAEDIFERAMAVWEDPDVAGWLQAWLKHCVGGYCAVVASGESEIFSLRDPANVPYITMEWSPETKQFVQIHGPENAEPTADVQPYLVEVIQQAFDGNAMGLILTGVSAKNVDLRGANLYGVNLRGADLSREDLTRANLADADLADALLVNADLRNATLINAALDGANLTGATLINAYLRDATLTGADLDGANLTNANLIRAYLFDADLRGADLTKANLTGANLTDTKLHNAKLFGAILTGANLTGANLTGAILTDAIFDATTTMPDGTKWRPPAGLGRYRARRF